MNIHPPATNFNEVSPVSADADLLAGFDINQLPIIARHWFGIEPFRTVGELTAEIVCDIKFRRQIDRTHRPEPMPRGDPAPLTLDDILPGRNPTAPEDRDSRQSLGKIKDEVIENLRTRHEATK